jgi:glycosyltransferase involved in cell wall biosynthesis
VLPSTSPAVLYVSYDGAIEPLGQSQVVAYLERLAQVAEITLISFEKPGPGREEMARRLEAAGVRWRSLVYHRRPPVLSTLRDVLAGARAVRAERRMRAYDIVHVRSDVPALIAMCSGSRRWRLLFDIRGFWADERVDLGSWRRGSPLYRLVRWCEARFYSRADAVVTLTYASVPEVRRRLRGRDVPVEVIPTCTAVERFAGSRPRPGGPHAVWLGSAGRWYRLDLAGRLAQALALPLTVLTGDDAHARALLHGVRADIRSVAPEDVPAELRAGDIGLCLLRPSFAKTASAPTRLAEYLAAGMPVAVTPGAGDLEALVEGEGVGAVLRDESRDGLAVAAATLRRLASDPAVRDHCRSLARERFALERGVRAYAALYQRLFERREL